MLEIGSAEKIAERARNRAMAAARKAAIANGSIPKVGRPRLCDDAGESTIKARQRHRKSYELKKNCPMKGAIISPVKRVAADCNPTPVPVSDDLRSKRLKESTRKRMQRARKKLYELMREGFGNWPLVAAVPDTPSTKESCIVPLEVNHCFCG